MRRSVGGGLGLDALAALYGDPRPRADAHRPQSRGEMRAAVHELAARGMTDYGIAAATRLSVEQVRRMLGEPTP